MNNPFLSRDYSENCPPVDEIWANHNISDEQHATFFSPNRSMDLCLEAYRKSNPISSTPIHFSPPTPSIKSRKYSELEQEDILRSEMYFADPKALQHLATPLHVRSTSAPLIKIELQSPVPFASSSLATRQKLVQPQHPFSDLLFDDHPHTSFDPFSPSPIFSSKTTFYLHQDFLADEFITPSKSCPPPSPFSPIAPTNHHMIPKDNWSSMFSPQVASVKTKKQRKRSPTRSLFPFLGRWEASHRLYLYIKPLPHWLLFTNFLSLSSQSSNKDANQAKNDLAHPKWDRNLANTPHCNIRSINSINSRERKVSELFAKNDEWSKNQEDSVNESGLQTTKSESLWSNEGLSWIDLDPLGNHLCKGQRNRDLDAAWKIGARLLAVKTGKELGAFNEEVAPRSFPTTSNTPQRCP